MVCKYCGKPVQGNSRYCPSCGQTLSEQAGKNGSGSYWNKVNAEDRARAKATGDIADRDAKTEQSRKRKTRTLIIALVIVMAAAVIGGVMLRNARKAEEAMVRQELVGRTLLAHDSHIEGLGNIIHEYWQLTFVDDTTADYAYVSTLGPRGNEEPHYVGTYTYTITHSVFGDYTILVDGTKYKLELNGDKLPSGLSR